MDSSSSSSSTTMSQKITQEEFFAFHNIDRQLFYRLVFNLRHEPAEAMQVAAFWLWLERTNMAQYVATILKFPDTVFEAVYEETVMCLRVVETDDSSVYLNDVPLVQMIIGQHREGINLKFFHDNRITVLLGVGNIVQQVCLRAFQDLIQFLMSCRSLDDYEFPPLPCIAGSRAGAGDGGGSSSGGATKDTSPGVIGGGIGHSRGSVGVVGGGIGGLRLGSQPPTMSPIHEENYGEDDFDCSNLIRVGDFDVPLNGKFDKGGIGSSNNVGNVPFMDKRSIVEAQNQALERDLLEIMAAKMRNENSWHHQISDERPNNILPSDRTIFLTFSKGYPIYEGELREFLTRTFGDIIEGLYMQEVVDEKEQALYARLVVRNLRAMELILSRQGRSKFSINGKHVWARKYVRKNTTSPPVSPAKPSLSG